MLLFCRLILTSVFPAGVTMRPLEDILAEAPLEGCSDTTIRRVAEEAGAEARQILSQVDYAGVSLPLILGEKDLNNPRTPEERFRAVAAYATSHGYLGAVPNFHEADDGHGKVYGTILIKNEFADWRDIPAAQLGNPHTPEERFRAVAAYATAHGYVGAFPNFFEADYGQGKVYGTLLLKPEAADWMDIRASQLGFRVWRG